MNGNHPFLNLIAILAVAAVTGLSGWTLSQNSKVAVLEERISTLTRRVDGLESKLDQVENKLDQVLNAVEARGARK